MVYKELIILVGPQGAGKTTYCKKELKGYTRISYDEMGQQHKQIFDTVIACNIEKIVIDKTNSTVKTRARFIQIGKQNNYRIKIIWFDISRQICEQRIVKRKNHETLKPEKAEEALECYFSKFEPPTNKEYDLFVRALK